MLSSNLQKVHNFVQFKIYLSAGTFHYCLYSPFAPFPFLHDGHPEDIHMQSLLRDCVQVVYGISDLSVFLFFFSSQMLKLKRRSVDCEKVNIFTIRIIK